MNHRDYFDALAFDCAVEKEIRDETARLRADLEPDEDDEVDSNENE